ncbi:transketolase subunit A [Trinickia symbiotica]|uniref:Transketolase n=1 Tax=Trinickia symbiotica TaxID=863227 RepID=A0A2N7X5S7_9BURK|nr:transketolase [Trinickia symbiotica]PMS36921.1 transketolase [Trinickia symbiotica]PPK41410.1 transketolase subunit A [Trinickia symbiotica]
MNKFDATHLRKTILDMAFAGSTVHIGCAFSIVELLAVLYRNHLRFDPLDAQSPNRDYMVLSKGHGVMAQYACLNEIGWLPDDELARYFENGTRLKGLADAHVPGVEVTAGSLGHGLSVGVGLALAAKREQTGQMCYALVGDGELNEGTIWEAALFAVQFKLDNLIVIVDVNGFQAMGRTDEVIGLGDIERKFAAFDFDVTAVDGHDERAIDSAYADTRSRKNGRPKAIIAKTVKGKGVSFMENDNVWHYTRLDLRTYESAVAELKENA